MPAIHFLLLPGVDAANFLGDLLRHFSLDEHNIMKTLSAQILHAAYFPFQIFETLFSMFRHKSSPGLGALHGFSPLLNRDNFSDLARFAKLAQKGFTEFGCLCYDTAHSREAPQEGAAFSLLMT